MISLNDAQTFSVATAITLNCISPSGAPNTYAEVPTLRATLVGGIN
jgi:hypothetical protein